MEMNIMIMLKCYCINHFVNYISLSLFLSLSILMAIFAGEPWLAGFIGAKDDGGGGDNWFYKTCQVPVKSSPPTNHYLTFYRPDALPVTNQQCQSTVNTIM